MNYIALSQVKGNVPEEINSFSTTRLVLTGEVRAKDIKNIYGARIQRFIEDGMAGLNAENAKMDLEAAKVDTITVAAGVNNGQTLIVFLDSKNNLISYFTYGDQRAVRAA